jgi:lactate 2-monooxygenase
MNTSAPERQRELYSNGFAGIKPEINIGFHRLEESAKARMSAKAYAYIAGGAGNESTLRANREGFEKLQITPQMLRNVGERDTSIELFGQRYASPFLLSPIGVLEMVHSEADVAVARAAASLQIPYIFSNQASKSMEDCAAVMNNAPRWFQLYWSKSNDLVASFIHRAEQCRCSAIVVTLDTTMLGWRTRDLEILICHFWKEKELHSTPVILCFKKCWMNPMMNLNLNEPLRGQQFVG